MAAISTATAPTPTSTPLLPPDVVVTAWVGATTAALTLVSVGAAELLALALEATLDGF
ncbi:hypothetical protein HK101_002487, partial [Irineochytrium annulatum]